MPDNYEAEQSRYLANQRAQLQMAVSRLDRHMSEEDNGGFIIMQITIQSPEHTGSNWRAIVKGHIRGDPLQVAFANAEDLAGIIRAVGQGVEENFLKWREDRPLQNK